MYEISDSYLSFMNSIILRRLRDEAGNNEAISYGLDGSVWPNCEPKAIAVMLNEKIKHGFATAKAITWAEKSEYLTLIRNNQLIPNDDVKVLVAKSDDLNKRYWAAAIAQELKDDYRKLDQLMSTYARQQGSSVRVHSLKDEIEPLVKENEKRLKDGCSLVKIPDFPLLSEMIAGFNAGSITMLTAKSGAGKTNLCVSLAQAASRVMNTLYLNLEMTAFDFASRFVHNGAKIDNKEWRTGEYSNAKNLQSIEEYAAQKSREFALDYTDGSALSPTQMKAEIYRRFDGKKNGLVIVDYTDKAILDGKKEEWMEMLNFFTDMEEVAKKTNTHIIMISQGDDVSGFAKASKRATQPCANVLNFYRVKSTLNPLLDRFFIKALKVRFGECQQLELEGDLAKSRLTEKAIVAFGDNETTTSRGKYEF